MRKRVYVEPRLVSRDDIPRPAGSDIALLVYKLWNDPDHPFGPTNEDRFLEKAELTSHPIVSTKAA